jgi:hypothetical protein
MINKIADFTRDLATGMSRRKAFLKFVGGAGALGFLGLRTASAQLPPQTQTQCINECLIYAGVNYDFCDIICDFYTEEKDIAFCQQVCFSGVDEYSYLFCAFYCTHPEGKAVETGALHIKEKTQEYVTRLTRRLVKALPA